MDSLAKVNIQNIVYQKQYFDIKILHATKDHVTMPNIVKLRLILTLCQKT